jgi:hypothetical protein
MNDMSNEFPTNVFVAPHAPQPVAPEPAPAPAVDTFQADVVDSLDAAAILRVTPNNLRQIVHKKQLVPVGKQGRRTIFTRSDVTALAESRGRRA